MSKIIEMPSNLKEINLTKSLVDGFIIGVKDMCVNTTMCITTFDILNDIKDKDIFISLNKNMHNSDLIKIEKVLKELNNYNIKGVLYYDVAVLSIYNKLDLNYDLVLSTEHSTTNYNTINYWNNFNVKYALLSNDITEDELIEICNNTNSKLMLTLFGYLPMFVSRRHIVKNYIDYFKLNNNSSINYIYKENNTYPIIDNSIGTYVYSNNILNGITSYLKLNLDYVILNSFNIEINKFIEIIKLFKNVNSNNVLEYNDKINNMFNNIDNGFLYTKTIYKVKKDEK